MRRLISVTLIMLIIMSLCTNVFAANPGLDLSIRQWALCDSGKNIGIEVIHYPKVTMTGNGAPHGRDGADEPALHEVIIKMDLSLSQKYLQYYKSGDIIPELIFCGLNISSRPVFKIKLENCMISGFAITELENGMLIDRMNAVVRIRAEKVSITSLDAPEGPMNITYGPKLNIGKLFINGAGSSGRVTLSSIEGYAGSGNVGFNSSELSIDYDAIGTLPDWLAGFDGAFDYTINPQCKLRYELTNTTSDDKFSFEVDMKAVEQELAMREGATKMSVKYTFQVYDVRFGVPATIAETPPAPADPAPAEPTNLLIKQPDFRRAADYTWAGKWVTTFGNMTLKQDGTKVTGEYGNPVETLEGTVSGSKLAGTWHDRLSSGKFEFTMSADGESFSGNMYSHTLGDRGTFEWSGDRE